MFLCKFKQFEAVIEKGHEGLAHHMIVYKCPGIDSKYVGTVYECYDPQYKHLEPCGVQFAGWAVGGQVG